MRLKDKVCVITGGGSGMGATAAKLFAQEGAKLIVADLLESAGRETVQAVTSQGGTALFVQADVSRESDCKKIMEEHKGTIEVHSQPSHGTTVTLQFPSPIS